jgi:hypothetical protein
MWSRKRADCSPDLFRLQSVTDSGPFFVAPAPVPAREQRNSAAVNTRLRHTDWHALWSSSYACAWCTPCNKGILPLLDPLRGNLPLAGVHFRALLASVTVLLHGAKAWQLMRKYIARALLVVGSLLGTVLLAEGTLRLVPALVPEGARAELDWRTAVA